MEFSAPLPFIAFLGPVHITLMIGGWRVCQEKHLYMLIVSIGLYLPKEGQNNIILGLSWADRFRCASFSVWHRAVDYAIP